MSASPAHLLCQLLVGEHGRIVEHVVVEDVIADVQQIHPVARFGDLQQPALVHVLVFEPDQGFVDVRPMLRQEIAVARQVEIEVMPQQIPEIAVHRTGVFGADIAGIRVDVELDQAAAGLKATHGFQRGACRRQQRCVAGGRRAQKDDHAVARPHLWIACGQGGSPIAVRRYTLMQDVQGALARLM